MQTVVDHLANYAGYHRDRRNIATHVLGIPLIVLAVSTLLSRPVLMELGGIAMPGMCCMSAVCWCPVPSVSATGASRPRWRSQPAIMFISSRWATTMRSHNRCTAPLAPWLGAHFEIRIAWA